MSELNFYLLQINDALFPIGAYSHSQGLETYIQRGIVHDEATAKEYIHHKIRWNLAFTELLAARLSYLAAAYGDLEQLLSIEEILEASRIPMEQREAARKMGSRFAKTIEKLELPVTKEENGIFRRYLTARKGQAINHCCIYGVFCAAMNIPLADALSYIRIGCCRRYVPALSLCADFRDRDKLRQNDPVKPERRTAASQRMLYGICRDFKRSGTPECGGSLSFCAGL